ncbi:LOW QUALITY PROTEIN: otoancorin [Aulostomus maculatus]
MWNCTNLPTMIKQMRNSSEETSCYMRAFLAPLCWAILTSDSKSNVSSDDYEVLLSAAKPTLLNTPLKRIKLPRRVERVENMKKMMRMMCEVYDSMSEEQRTQVGRWGKEQITQKYFNCTQRLSSNSSSMSMESCKPSLKWLNLEALFLMGPYVGHLSPDDVDSSPEGKLKKQLLRSVTSTHNWTDSQVLHKMGSAVALLSPEQLSKIPRDKLKGVLKNLGPEITWKKEQLRTLIKKQLGDKKCEEVLGKELIVLQSAIEGVPSCMLKHVNAREVLDDPEGLKKVTQRMKKGQLKAMLQGLQEKVESSELVLKLPGPLLNMVALNVLDKEVMSLEQAENKTWSRPQAAFLVKKLHDGKQLHFRKLHSLLQGVTCKMIGMLADRGLQDMSQAMEETPQWISKARCLALKYFATLEAERPDYFKTITEEELDDIPSSLILQLPPPKVKSLPDAVCVVFINKMNTANLSLIPLRCPSRPALAQRALLCLLNGGNLFSLTEEDVSRMGPLLCELQPSQLWLMAPDVLSYSLQAMASCQHIPYRHRAELVELVKKTFGDPSDWSADTMESLGPLLLLDDDSVHALSNKPWMKAVIYFLKSHLIHISDALKKKLFDLSIPPSTPPNSNNETDNSTNTVSDNGPTVEVIEELGMLNVYWTATQLDEMSADTFRETVEIFGAISDFKEDQLIVLSQKITEVFGPASQVNESVVMQMGCIAQGFSNSDLEKLAFSLDTLEEIANCGWNESQMECVWKSVARRNNLTAQQLGAAEMVALDQFLCGLSSSELSQLNIDAFRDAMGSINGIQCSFKVAQQLKNLSVSAFGDPSTWTEATVSTLGNVVGEICSVFREAGLDASELASLDASLFSFLSVTSIPLILPNTLAALSVAQLEALGPDNAAMVTSEQGAALRDEQLAALERAVTRAGDAAPVQNLSEDSGAPSVSVEGILAYVKPLLFLLTGLLLL